MSLIFALDHTNHYLWFSVHICDMVIFVDIHQDVLSEFKFGMFVVHKTNNKLSVMAIDQCHGHNTTMVQ